MKAIDDFEKVSTPRARKAHRCDACRAEIPVGRRYLRVSSCYEQCLSTEAKCASCAGFCEYPRKL